MPAHLRGHAGGMWSVVKQWPMSGTKVPENLQLLRFDPHANLLGSLVVANAKGEGGSGIPGGRRYAIEVTSGGRPVLAYMAEAPLGGTYSMRVTRRDPWGYPSCEAAGVCGTKSIADCDDADPCTADNCDPLAGCTHKPIPVAAECATGSKCNAAGKCEKP